MYRQLLRRAVYCYSDKMLPDFLRISVKWWKPVVWFRACSHPRHNVRLNSHANLFWFSFSANKRKNWSKCGALLSTFYHHNRPHPPRLVACVPKIHFSRDCIFKEDPYQAFRESRSQFPEAGWTKFSRCSERVGFEVTSADCFPVFATFYV